MTKRLPTIVLAVVAIALTVTGIVLAATDPNPRGGASDHLALNGYPPRSAQLLVTVSTGQAYSLSANVNVNFDSNNVEAIVHFPMVFALASVDLKLVNNHLYAGSAEATSGPYFSIALKQPSLFGVALEMTKPDIALITGFSKSITRNGDFTTYDFRRSGVAISNVLGGSKSPAMIGSLVWTITVGKQGEVTQSTLVVKGPRSVTTLSATVISYNQSAKISAPPAAQVKPVNASVITSLLGSVPLSTVLMPQNLTSLGQLHLN